jgi:uncharacterized protein (TIGR00255 family)
MTLHSMTGFGRAEGSLAGQRWHWEVRSVNGRGLDVRLKVPPGFEALEAAIRDLVGKRMTRGSVNVAMTVSRPESDVEIRLNERALAQVAKAAERIADLTGGERPSADGLMAIRGVLEVVEPVEDESLQKARAEAMLATLGDALDRLVAARRAEGQRLSAILTGQIDQIAEVVARLEVLPSRRPEAIAQRLKEQMAKLLDATSALDPTRLHQEAVLLATRADVEEELKRLAAHVAAARDLVGAAEPVGRKLDFLSQEFNREANTLCSKSNDIEMTRLGLELKAVIDQMREQIQNIE